MSWTRVWSRGLWWEPLLGPLVTLFLLALPTLIHKFKQRKKRLPGRQKISILSTRRIGRSRSRTYIKHTTKAGHIARNELDTHADTCCTGANWKLLELTRDICKVTPFLDSYEPISKIPLARCGMVWTDPMTMQDYLLVSDQMLWFGENL